MTPLWTLQSDPSPASVSLTEDALILENRYIKRTINRATGLTESITDGDGVEAVSAP